MRRLAIILVPLFAAVASFAQERGAPQEPASRVRFEAVDVFIDSHEQPLAAYQFELFATTGNVKIVGVEGGEHPAFHEPPYYDPAALTQDRIIIAAFSTATELPSGRTRVARLHMQVNGAVEPQYKLRLIASATQDGGAIAAEIEYAPASTAPSAGEKE